MKDKVILLIFQVVNLFENLPDAVVSLPRNMHVYTRYTHTQQHTCIGTHTQALTGYFTHDFRCILDHASPCQVRSPWTCPVLRDRRPGPTCAQLLTCAVTASLSEHQRGEGRVEEGMRGREGKRGEATQGKQSEREAGRQDRGKERSGEG